MPQLSITQLPLAQALTGTESVPIVQNGVTVQTTTGAVAGAGALNFPFLTVGSAAGLTQGRYLATGSGLTLTDNGAGNSLQINLTGASQSLDTAGLGLLVKTSSTTVGNVSIVVGTGMTIANADGSAGNPTIGLNNNLQTLALMTGVGIMTINGGAFGQVTLTGVSNQITVTNGNAASGYPTFGIANNPVLPGAGGVQVPTGGDTDRLGVNGVIRYNTDSARFEGFQNNTWANLGTGDGTVKSVNGTTNQILIANSTVNPIISIYPNPTLPGNSYVQLPAGTTAQRGTPIYGALRYNSDTGGLEAYTQATGWGAIISGAGVSTFSASGTGLTPSSPMSGGIVLGGILNGATGGTGVNNGVFTITVGGNVSTGGAFTVSGSYPVSLTATSSTSITLPTTGTLATLAGIETLTNKSMSGSANTFTNIPNSALVNNSVTYNGVNVALGGSGTITATATNALTIGTGLTGTSYNGSTPVTITIDSTVATLTGIQTLTNKSMSGSSNTFTNIPNGALTNSSVTLGTTTVALGGTSLTLGGLTSVTVTQDPVSALQLATKQYVDSVAQGLNVKSAVACATTANITLSGEQTIDGVTTSSSRVLVKNQTTQANNGIYVSSSGAWTRSTDADTWNELVSAFVFVQMGTTQGDTGWVCTVDPGGTLGVTAVTWVQFSGAGTYTAGTGLTLTGTQFSLTAPVLASLGGTGYISYTAGDTLYASGSTTLSKLGIGTANYIYTSSGSAPQWSNPTGITVGTATNVGGGAAGAIVYNTGAGATTFLSLGTTNYVLTAGASAPQYVAQSTLSVGSATTATNLASGAAGSLPYQSGAGATTFLSLGTTNYVLTAGASAPKYVAQSTLSVGSATNATNATNTGITVDTTDTTTYLTFVTATSGNLPQLVNSSITANASTGKITGGIAGGAF